MFCAFVGDDGLSSGVIAAIVVPLGAGATLAVFAAWYCFLSMRKMKISAAGSQQNGIVAFGLIDPYNLCFTMKVGNIYVTSLT